MAALEAKAQQMYDQVSIFFYSSMNEEYCIFPSLFIHILFLILFTHVISFTLFPFLG